MAREKVSMELCKDCRYCVGIDATRSIVEPKRDVGNADGEVLPVRPVGPTILRVQCQWSGQVETFVVRDKVCPYDGEGMPPRRKKLEKKSNPLRKDTGKKYIGVRHEDGVFVTVDGYELEPGKSQSIINHSPDGFEFGYGGSGPSQLALAILLEHFTTPDTPGCGDPMFKTCQTVQQALKNYQDFKQAFVAKFDKGEWILTSATINEWLKERDDDTAWEAWCFGCEKAMAEVYVIAAGDKVIFTGTKEAAERLYRGMLDNRTECQMSWVTGPTPLQEFINEVEQDALVRGSYRDD